MRQGRPQEAIMERIELTIGGMTCEHCVRAVTKALSRQPGTTVEEVTVGRARVSNDPGAVAPKQLTAAVEDEGYEVLSQEVPS
jgi:copper chaperone